MHTSDGELRALQLRTGALERRLRAQRWQFAAAIVVVLVLVWLLLPAASATVAAETFVLTDASGTRRAEMSMILDQPTVTIYDANGQIVGGFRVGADGRPTSIDPAREPM